MSGDVKALLERIVGSLVEHPADLEIKERLGEAVEVFEIRVSHRDAASVIGKGGSTMTAIRTLFTAVGRHDKKRYVIEVNLQELEAEREP